MVDVRKKTGCRLPRRFILRATGFCTSFSILILVPVIAASAETYIVSAGDSLSEIAHRTWPGRVYGADGSLAQLLALNPRVKQANRIFPGARLQLSRDGKTLRITRATSTQSATAPQTVLSKLSRRPASKIEEGSLTDQMAPDPERSLLHVAPRFSFNAIEATDHIGGARASVASDLSLGAELDWQLVLNSLNQFIVGVSYDQLNERTVGKGLDQASVARSRLGLGFEHRFDSPVWLSTNVSIESAPFLQSTSASTISVTSLWIPQLELAFGLRFFKSNLFSFGARVVGAFRGPASRDSIDAKPGFAYGTSLSLTQIRGRAPLSARVFYQRNSQNTGSTDQTESVIGLAFGLDFDLTPPNEIK